MPSEVTDAQIAQVIALYKTGKTQTAIASEMSLPDAAVKQILTNHGVRRSSRKFCGLTEEQDEDMLTYLKNQDSYQGSYRILRGMMENFVREHDIKCDFSQTWRRSFHSRHQNVLPPVIRTLLSLRPDQDDTEVVTEGDDSERAETTSTQDDMEDVEEEEILPGKEEGGEGEVVEVDDDLFEAVQEALLVYTKAGLTEERARTLLRNMNVPGFGAPLSTTKKSSKAKKKKGKIASVSQAAPSVSKTPSVVDAKAQPAKKTPLQMRVLEREFVKNPQMGSDRAAELGDKLGLAADQVIAWFRNKRHKRPTSSRR